MSGTGDELTEPNRPRGRIPLLSPVRAAAIIALAALFALPAIASAYPRHDAAVHLSVAIGLLPVGGFLVTRLYPDRPIPVAVASLFVPVGALWMVSGYVPYVRAGTLSSLGDLPPNLGTILIGMVLLLVGTGSAFESRTAAYGGASRRERRNLIVAQLAARIMGAFLVAMIVVLPLLANTYRNAEIARAPIILGLLPVGAFLITRPAPRHAAAAVATTLLLPLGSVVFMFGVMKGAPATSGPDIGTVAAGLVVLAAAAVTAWRTWGLPGRRRLQIVARTLAIIVWGVTATLSIQDVAEEPTLNYVGVFDLEIVGTDLFVEVPFQGGCGTGNLTVTTELRGDVLEVLVSEPVDAFHCLAGCVAAQRPACTEVVQHRLYPPPPAGITLVAAKRPATGLLRLPFALLAAGLVVGTALWRAGRSQAGRAVSPTGRVSK